MVTVMVAAVVSAVTEAAPPVRNSAERFVLGQVGYWATVANQSPLSIQRVTDDAGV